MSARFKMNFNNYGSFSQSAYYNNIAPPVANIPLRSVAAPKQQALNAPMIGRVYKAKPGCSSCGKKVA
jgi:hypothetical protein